MSSQKLYYKDHPSVEIPEFLRIDGWEDVSWVNDELPCSQLKLSCGAGFRVWVGYEGEYCVEFVRSLEYGPDNAEVIYQGKDLMALMFAMNQRRFAHITEILLGLE